MTDRPYQGKRVYTPRATEPLRTPLKQTLKISGPPIEMWICSAELLTVAVHWDGERNQPCYYQTDKADCEHCMATLPRKKQHWLTVQCSNRGSPVQLVCLTTPAVYEELLLEEWAGQLSGHKLRLWREPAQLRGRMHAKLDRSAFCEFLPDVPDTLSVLEKMWNGKLRRLRFDDEVDGAVAPTAKQQKEAAEDEARKRAAEAREMVRQLEAQLGKPGIADPKGARRAPKGGPS